MAEATQEPKSIRERLSNLTDRRAIRAGATAVAATATLFVAGCGSNNQTQVASHFAKAPKYLKSQWNSLTDGAKRLMLLNSAGFNSDSVAVSGGPVIYPNNTTGNSTTIQSDVYDSSSQALEEYVIEIDTPPTDQHAITVNGLGPNSTFQIDLYESKRKGVLPTNPNAFDNAIDTHPWIGRDYNFSLDETSDGYLEVDASSSNKGPGLWYITDPKASPQHLLSGHTALVERLLEQAERVEEAAVYQLPLPTDQPTISQAPSL